MSDIALTANGESRIMQTAVLSSPTWNIAVATAIALPRMKGIEPSVRSV
jgi:hypothetical protein